MDRKYLWFILCLVGGSSICLSLSPPSFTASVILPSDPPSGPPVQLLEVIEYMGLQQWAESSFGVTLTDTFLTSRNIFFNGTYYFVGGSDSAHVYVYRYDVNWANKTTVLTDHPSFSAGSETLKEIIFTRYGDTVHCCFLFEGGVVDNLMHYVSSANLGSTWSIGTTLQYDGNITDASSFDVIIHPTEGIIPAYYVPSTASTNPNKLVIYHGGYRVESQVGKVTKGWLDGDKYVYLLYTGSAYLIRIFNCVTNAFSTLETITLSNGSSVSQIGQLWVNAAGTSFVVAYPNTLWIKNPDTTTWVQVSAPLASNPVPCWALGTTTLNLTYFLYANALIHIGDYFKISRFDTTYSVLAAWDTFFIDSNKVVYQLGIVDQPNYYKAELSLAPYTAPKMEIQALVAPIDNEYVFLYDLNDVLFYQGWVETYQFDGASYAYTMRSPVQQDLDTKVTTSYIAQTAKQILQDLFTNWCLFLSEGTLSSTPSATYTISFTNKALVDIIKWVDQHEGYQTVINPDLTVDWNQGVSSGKTINNNPTLWKTANTDAWGTSGNPSGWTVSEPAGTTITIETSYLGHTYPVSFTDSSGSAVCSIVKDISTILIADVPRIAFWGAVDTASKYFECRVNEAATNIILFVFDDSSNLFKSFNGASYVTTGVSWSPATMYYIEIVLVSTTQHDIYINNVLVTGPVGGHFNNLNTVSANVSRCSFATATSTTGYIAYLDGVYWGTDATAAAESYNFPTQLTDSPQFLSKPLKLSKVTIYGAFVSGVQLVSEVQGEANWGEYVDWFPDIRTQTELDNLANAILTNKNITLNEIKCGVVGKGFLNIGKYILVTLDSIGVSEDTYYIGLNKYDALADTNDLTMSDQLYLQYAQSEQAWQSDTISKLETQVGTVEATEQMIHVDTGDPTGIPPAERAKATLSCSNAGLFSLTKISNWYYYYQGVKHTITATKTLDVSSYTAGDLIFVWIDGNEALQSSTTFPGMDKILVSFIYKTGLVDYKTGLTDNWGTSGNPTGYTTSEPAGTAVTIVASEDGHTYCVEITDSSATEFANISRTASVITLANVPKASFWIKVDTASKQGRVLIYEGVNARAGLRFENDNQIKYNNSGSYVQLNGQTWTADTWYFVRFQVVSSTTSKWWINEVDQGTVNTAGTISANLDAIWFGTSATDTGGYKLYLDGVYWGTNATAASASYLKKFYWCAEERHGFMDPRSHYHWHKGRGPMLYSGGVGTFQNSATYASIAAFQFADEDIELTVTEQTTGWLMYRVPTTLKWRKENRDFTVYPFYNIDNSARVVYDNAGTLTDVTNNKWAIIWVMLSPFDTGKVHYFFGQAIYATLAAAEAAIIGDSTMSITGLPSPEMYSHYKIILQQKAAAAPTIVKSVLLTNNLANGTVLNNLNFLTLANLESVLSTSTTTAPQSNLLNSELAAGTCTKYRYVPLDNLNPSISMHFEITSATNVDTVEIDIFNESYANGSVGITVTQDNLSSMNIPANTKALELEVYSSADTANAGNGGEITMYAASPNYRNALRIRSHVAGITDYVQGPIELSSDGKIKIRMRRGAGTVTLGFLVRGYYI